MRIDLDFEAIEISESYDNMMKEELSQKKHVETENGFEGHCGAVFPSDIDCLEHCLGWI